MLMKFVLIVQHLHMGGNLIISKQEVSGIKLVSFHLSNQTQERNNNILYLQPNTKQMNETGPVGWKGKLMNFAGRRVLVRTVLSSLPTFALTVLKVPKRVLKENDKARRRFLWAQD